MKATTKIKIRIQTKGLPSYFIVLSSLLIIAWLTDKYAEAVCFALSFVCLRYKFNTTYHCKTIAICIMFSSFLVYLGMLTVLSVNVSLVFSTLVSFAIMYFAYIVADRIEVRRKYKQLTTPRPFNIETATEQEWIDKCNQLGFSQEQKEFVIMAFVKKLKHKDIADILSIDEKSVTMRKYRIKKELK